MAVLFVNQPGRAVMLSTGAPDAGLPLAIGGHIGSWYLDYRSIITEATVQLAGNFQIQHTLSDVIYAYAFGDKIAHIRIAGLSFSGACPGNTDSGLELIFAYYAKNKIAARSDLIQIQIGSNASGRFRGYLVGLGAGLTNTESQISQFGLDFLVFPESNP